MLKLRFDRYIISNGMFRILRLLMYTWLTRLKRCVKVLWCSVVRLSEYVTGTHWEILRKRAKNNNKE